MEIATGVVSIIVNAVKLGNTLVDLYFSIRDASDDIAERLTHVRAVWLRTQTQLEFMQRVCFGFDHDYLAIQEESLKVLVAKLTSATVKIHGLLKKRSRPGTVPENRPQVRMWKYVFVKPYLEDTIKSLDLWQKMYDPSWYLILRLGRPAIDQELKKATSETPRGGAEVLKTAARLREVIHGNAAPEVHVFLRTKEHGNSRGNPIPYCSAHHMQRAGTDKWYLIDSIPCPEGDHVHLVTTDVRKLACKLRHVDPDVFGILRSKGVIKVKACTHDRLTCFDVVFETPSRQPPRSLRECLMKGTSHTLTQRVDVAKQLAKSVNYVHALDLVHKNVRPENLVGFGHGELGCFYLLGFEQMRSVNAKSFLRGDTEWQKNLYRHPSRQGLHPEQLYDMQHDIYSLGVCLLEIGIWRSFVCYGDDGEQSLDRDLFGCSIRELRSKSPDQVKNLLVGIARRLLPGTVGEIYREVVINCLTCLDEDNVDFGEKGEFDGTDGVAVGIRYVDKILMQLNSITV